MEHKEFLLSRTLTIFQRPVRSYKSAFGSMDASTWESRYDYRYYSVAGYDYKNSLFRSTLQFNNISATAGATVGIRENGTLNLNISSAWRPPHVAELYSVGTHQSAAANEYGFLLNDSTNEVLDIDDVSFKTEQALKFVTRINIDGIRFIAGN